MEVLRQILRLISHVSSRLLPSRLPWITLQDFVSPRSPVRPTSEGTVILGAGVIGLSTAYYLAMALDESRASKSAPLWPPVVVVDPSSDICSGASGEATGGLGDFGFSSETSPLGLLSYRLHKELASKFGGREKWGFSDLEIYRVTPKDFTGNPSPLDSWGPALPVGRKLSDLPNWIKASEDWAVQSLAEAPHSAHLDPRRFCQFLRERCEILGVQFRLNSAVTSFERDDYRHSFTSVTLETRQPERSIENIPCNAIVIAAGPWSPRVLSQLFPTLRLKLRMNSITSAGNHAMVRNLHWKPSDDEKGVTQVFFNNVLPGSHRLDITSFLGGTLYIGGWGARPEQVPEYADDIRPQPDQIEAMLEVTRSFLRTQPGENLEVLNTGRCYRPLAIPNKPIIGKVDWCLLYDNEPSTAKLHPKHHNDCPLPTILGGLYINTGHNSDGVTLGPGSGNIMSKYLLGCTSTVQVSLEPLDYDEKTSREQHYL